MQRRTLIHTAIAAAAGGLSALSAFAQGAWPTGKAITYVVPFPPGGNTDTLARLIAQPLSTALGTPIVIDNKGGAGGSVGSAIASRAPADGAKNGGLSSGSPGIGTSPHMALELLASQSGVKFTHAPYKGSGPAVQDLVGGQLDMMFDTSLIVGPHIQSGRLRPIAVTGSQRVPGYPNVPTIAESGQKGFDMVSWQAMFVPANTPQPVIDRLHAEVMKVLALPDVQAKLKVFGMEPSGMTPAQLLAYQKTEVDKWAKVIKAANIKAE
jgi:tripartite-type tricarboxylate transporter receptor subunit TctC